MSNFSSTRFVCACTETKLISIISLSVTKKAKLGAPMLNAPKRCDGFPNLAGRSKLEWSYCRSSRHKWSIPEFWL